LRFFGRCEGDPMKNGREPVEGEEKPGKKPEKKQKKKGGKCKGLKGEKQGGRGASKKQKRKHEIAVGKREKGEGGTFLGGGGKTGQVCWGKRQ